MKVLLTTPPQPTQSISPNRYKSLYRALRWLGGNKPILGIQPPYGLMYISSYLKRDNHEVFIVDGLISSLEYILELIKERKIDIVGISSVSWNWHEAKKLAGLLRTTYPHLKLAVGGAHVNAEQGKALEGHPYFDYAFYGDSEESFCNVVGLLSSGGKMEPIDGFAYRDGEKIIASEKNAIIKDINSILFPDRDSLGLTNYRPSPLSYRRQPFTAMFGSRGCPYQCTFCHTDKHVRMRKAENLVEEIELLQKKYNVREIMFYDDTFSLNKRRIFEFCELLINKKIDLSWTASARVDTVDKEMLHMMKKAGCWRLCLGIESGSQRLLNRMKKNVTLEQIKYAVDIINTSGLQILGMFMFGIPTETYEEGVETIKFIKRLKLDYISVNNITPFPGTEIYNEVCNEAGFKGLDSMNMFDISYVPKTMKESELRELLKRCMREFYLRPSYMLHQFRNIKSFTDIVRYVRGSVLICLR